MPLPISAAALSWLTSLRSFRPRALCVRHERSLLRALQDGPECRASGDPVIRQGRRDSFATLLGNLFDEIGHLGAGAVQLALDKAVPRISQLREERALRGDVEGACFDVCDELLDEAKRKMQDDIDTH